MRVYDDVPKLLHKLISLKNTPAHLQDKADAALRI